MRKKYTYFKVIAVLLAVQFFMPSFSQAGEVSTCDVPEDPVTPVVTAEAADDGVLVSWEKIDHERLEGYKLVISKNNPNPKYSEDGYLKWITDTSVISFLVKSTYKYYNGDFGYYLEQGESYYFSITAVYNCSYKVAGNAVLIQFPGNTTDDNDDKDDQTTDDSWKDVKEEIKEEVKDIKKEVKEIKKEAKEYKHEYKKDHELDDIKDKAKKLTDNRLEDILAELKQLRNLVKEQDVQIKHLKGLTHKLQNIAEHMQSAIQNFVAYGVDDNTQKLGEGERAAVVHSYEKAFGKLPESEADLEDAIKIANGRWPSQRSLQAEQQALEHFQKVYKRLPNYSHKSDEAAITIMSYGLRQKAENRKLHSEQKGINIFKDIYGYAPESTEDWNIMQAITYSGASR